jgi:hypothetical protein|tara:strand:+ start:122 stop:700 length:579 start_codon:yes stop_codon:yes gene_type:complete
MKTKVIDNFLTKSYHKELIKLLDSAKFPWYYNSHISGESFYKKRLYETGFSHIFWDNGSGGQRDSVYSWFWTPALYKIMDVVKNNFIIRSRGDMTMYTHKLFEHDPHVDFSFPHISTVYYVNNSDGDTIFYKEKAKKEDDIKSFSKLNEVKRVSPKANRLVVFEGDTIHTGSSPNKNKNRIIINSNFAMEKF